MWFHFTASASAIQGTTLGSHIRHCILPALCLGDDMSRLQVICCSTLPAASVSCDYLLRYLLVASVRTVDGAGIARGEMVADQAPDHCWSC
jgi:hypothetical protein